MNNVLPPHNGNPLTTLGNGRIEYIDAMRGFAMLMVVWGHVSMFDGLHGFETIMWHFAMPLFFFISGLVTYREGKVWNINSLVTFFTRKTSVLLAFPFLCMCVCSVSTKQCAIVDALWHQQKMGYWFVFTLFCCNLVYILLQLILQRIKAKGVADLVLFVLAIGTFLSSRVLWKYCGIGSEALVEGSRSIAGLLSWMPFAANFQWFVCGIIARRHYAAFSKCLSSNPILIVCVLVMIALSQQNNVNAFAACLAGYCSTFLVISFFHKHRQSFASNSKLGSLLQYVGRRTLDIYLLHYFFWYTTDFTVFAPYYQHSPVLKLVITMSFAIVVTALSLLTGNVLRLSSFIAHYGFGAKK